MRHVTRYRSYRPSRSSSNGLESPVIAWRSGGVGTYRGHPCMAGLYMRGVDTRTIGNVFRSLPEDRCARVTMCLRLVSCRNRARQRIDARLAPAEIAIRSDRVYVVTNLRHIEQALAGQQQTLTRRATKH